MVIEPMSTDPAAAGRIRRLTQAALNADVTIGRVEGVVGEIGTSLDYFRNVLGTFDGTLDKFGGTLDSLVTSIDGIDDVVDALSDTQKDLDGLVSALGEVVSTVNWLLTPVHVAREQLSKLPEIAAAAAAALPVAEIGALVGALTDSVLQTPSEKR